MARPTTKTELLQKMDDELSKLHNTVLAIELPDRIARGACDDWSVKDLLAHLDAWHEMFLGWEDSGSRGEKPSMPAPGYSWAETPALNQEIYEKTRDDDFQAVAKRFHSSHGRVRKVVESYSDEDLFTKKRFAWTGSTSIGSYAVSATSSHYEWARKLIAKYAKTLS